MAAALRLAERGGATGEVPAAPSRRDAPSSVAVLPFLDLSAARDQDYLCDGIAEEILTSLTHVEGLRVAARSSSFQLKAEGVEARTAGARLGVDAVLEGAVRKAGDRLRVTVQLVDVAGGFQRWSHRFDGNVADVFAIQDEIATAVASQLRGALSASTQNALRRPGTTPEAYEQYLRARQLLRNHHATSVAAAAVALGRAIALDPSYAPAYAALAQVHAFAADWYGGGDRAREAADNASAQAVALGPELAETHVARAATLAMRRDYPAAVREYEEALRRNPQSFDACYHLARACLQSGDDERALANFRRGAEVQMDDFQCPILAAVPLRRLGRDGEVRGERARGAAARGARARGRADERARPLARRVRLGRRRRARPRAGVGPPRRRGRPRRRRAQLQRRLPLREARPARGGARSPGEELRARHRQARLGGARRRLGPVPR